MFIHDTRYSTGLTITSRTPTRKKMSNATLPRKTTAVLVRDCSKGSSYRASFSRIDHFRRLSVYQLRKSRQEVGLIVRLWIILIRICHRWISANLGPEVLESSERHNFSRIFQSSLRGRGLTWSDLKDSIIVHVIMSLCTLMGSNK